MKSSRPPSRLSRSTTPHKPPHHLPSTTPLDQDHITVTPTTSIILQKCRPLPEDIASMSESDTACTFCGVSYLMLRKYEELVKHVANVEEEMRGLKRYAVENPGLVERICELECSQNEFKQTIQDLETTSQKHQETHSQTVRAFHELQLRHTRLTHEMVQNLFFYVG
ncbi:hypothetical protein BC829DRAFT_385332 [Chytridium lagenaria]|nr:hypothetical protein BC829DRAFT_385332 [Chytridium lagenaria]